MKTKRDYIKSIERAKLGLNKLETQAKQYSEIYSLRDCLLNTDQLTYDFFKTKNLAPSYRKEVLENLTSHLEEELKTLWAGGYIPEAVYEHTINKETKPRRVSPCGGFDKVIQTTFHNGLGRIYAPEFSKHSYAYQNGKSIDLCISNLKQSFENSKNIYAVKLDLIKCFDNIPHSHILDFLSLRIKDQKFLDLVRVILATEVINRRSKTPRGTGIIQGSVIGPVLSNVFLHHVFDLWYLMLIDQYGLNSFFARYADDLILFFSSRQDAECYLQYCHYRFLEYGLKIHPQKSKLIDISKQKIDYIGYSLFYSNGRLRAKKKQKEEAM